MKKTDNKAFSRKEIRSMDAKQIKSLLQRLRTTAERNGLMLTKSKHPAFKQRPFLLWNEQHQIVAQDMDLIGLRDHVTAL